MKRWQIFISGILLGLIFGGFVFLVASPKSQPSLTYISPTLPGSITISITGAVVHPGVYTLPVGARINDAITAAGGTIAQAKLDGLSLAQVMDDEDNIFVPTIDVVQRSSNDDSQGKIDINKATAQQLDSLPGIGEEKAQAIIDYREKYGKFSSIEDLLYVPGFGQAIFDSLKDLIDVN